MVRREFAAKLVVGGLEPQDARAAKDAVMSALTRVGFAAPLPDLRRVACLNRDGSSVLISIADVNKWSRSA